MSDVCYSESESTTIVISVPHLHPASSLLYYHHFNKSCNNDDRSVVADSRSLVK